MVTPDKIDVSIRVTQLFTLFGIFYTPVSYTKCIMNRALLALLGYTVLQWRYKTLTEGQQTR